VRLRALLLAAGARVVMTRDSNTGVGPCITERAAIATARTATRPILHSRRRRTGERLGFAILITRPIPSRAKPVDHRSPSRDLALALRTSLVRDGLHPSTYDGVDGLAHAHGSRRS